MPRIKIQDLLPLLKPGFVAMDSDGTWWWYDKEPSPNDEDGIWMSTWAKAGDCSLSAFDIAPFEGDWKKSLWEYKGIGL